MSTIQTAAGSRLDGRVAIAIGLACTVFYTGFTQAKFKSSDAVGVFAVTESLFERQTLEVPVHHHAHPGVDGRLYHAWAVGQSVLALPLYGLAKLARMVLPESWAIALAGRKNKRTRRLDHAATEKLREAGLENVRKQTLTYAGSLEIFFVGLFAPLTGGALVGVFYLLGRCFGASVRGALAAAMLTGLCSYPAMMSIYFLRHTTETLSLLIAFVLFHRYRENGSRWLLALGSLAASTIFLVRFPGVLCGPGLAVYLLWCIRERTRTASEPLSRTFAPVLVPLCTAIATHSALNYIRWGDWFTSPMTRGGFETSTSFWTSLSAFLWSPGISVFAYSPLLLLLPWTLRPFWRNQRWACIAIAVIAATELLYFSNYRFWTGLWSAPGPRYLFPASVLLMLPLGVWLDRPGTPIRRVVVWGLAGLGAAVQLSLLISNWGGVILAEHYPKYEPPLSFLYIPAASPIVASARHALEGRIDSWLWVLGKGWRNHPAQPAIAVALSVAWLAACAMSFARVHRIARSAQREP